MGLPTRLLTLNLGLGIEFPDAQPMAATDDDFFPLGPRGEGDEELHRFGMDLITMGPDGPRCRRPLPSPRASHRRRAPDNGTGGVGASQGSKSAPCARLAAGLWLFTQWRPADGGELAMGIEWFAREAWWEGRELEGELFLRLVGEDEKLAFQLLRRLAPPSPAATPMAQ